MNIQIDQPKLEALIHQRMASGRYATVEDLLLRTLEASPETALRPNTERKSLAQLFAESPFRGLDMEFPRDPSPLRLVDLWGRSSSTQISPPR